jgi:glycosyltransferase involved in cell wall biosynthesis
MASMQDQPLVAIVTPVYNGAEFLAETMDCVQAQTYPNIVHVILDNASTDETPDIIERYRGAKTPLAVSRNDVLLPLIQNWNAAIRLVPDEAKYFRVLSADDLIAPDYVAKKVALGELHPSVGVIGCKVHLNDEPAFPSPWPTDQPVFAGVDVVRRYFRSQCWVPTAHAFYRADQRALQQPFFDETVLVSDLAASLEVMMRADMGFVHEDLAMTRLSANTITATVVEPRATRMPEWLYLVQKFAPLVYDRDEAGLIVELYRRYYLRQLIRWRLGERRWVFEEHMERLRELKLTPALAQYFDAVLDWGLVRLGLRRAWAGYN